jgi:large subunit ribosomal protein L5
VTIVTSANTNAEAKSLLQELGMPFSDKAKQQQQQKKKEEAAA